MALAKQIGDYVPVAIRLLNKINRNKTSPIGLIIFKKGRTMRFYSVKTTYHVDGMKIRDADASRIFML